MSRKKNKKEIESDLTSKVRDESAEDVMFESSDENSGAVTYTSVFVKEAPSEAEALFVDETLGVPTDDDQDNDHQSVDCDNNGQNVLVGEENVCDSARELNNIDVLDEESEGLSAQDVIDDSELSEYDSVEIEDLEFIEDERIESIVESVLFATDKPVSINALRQIFKGTQVKPEKLRRTIEKLSIEYASGNRGIYIEEIQGGYQLRTKLDNVKFLQRTLKVKPFKLSGPALEVLAIIAYKQPVIKHEVDEIRGVESGHLLRALMEKSIVAFAGKSDLPGRPMQYITTKKFLEIFGLRNLKELPTLSQIDELLPEGVTEDDEIKNSKLSSITDSLSQNVQTGAYSQGEDDLLVITEQLEGIATSSDFFEQEKLRQKQKKDQEKAQNIREALELEESVPQRDINWLKRYDEALQVGQSVTELVASNEDNEGMHHNQNEEAVVAEVEYIESITFEEPEDELPVVDTEEEEAGL